MPNTTLVTEEMIEAGLAAYGGFKGGIPRSHGELCRDIYTAMHSARQADERVVERVDFDSLLEEVRSALETILRRAGELSGGNVMLLGQLIDDVLVRLLKLRPDNLDRYAALKQTGVSRLIEAARPFSRIAVMDDRLTGLDPQQFGHHVSSLRAAISAMESHP